VIEGWSQGNGLLITGKHICCMGDPRDAVALPTQFQHRHGKSLSEIGRRSGLSQFI